MSPSFPRQGRGHRPPDRGGGLSGGGQIFSEKTVDTARVAAVETSSPSSHPLLGWRPAALCRPRGIGGAGLHRRRRITGFLEVAPCPGSDANAALPANRPRSVSAPCWRCCSSKNATPPPRQPPPHPPPPHPPPPPQPPPSPPPGNPPPTAGPRACPPPQIPQFDAAPMAVVAPPLAPEAADPAGAEAPTPSAPPRAAGLPPAGGTDRRDQPDGSPPAPADRAGQLGRPFRDGAFRGPLPDGLDDDDELFADLFASADRSRHPDDGGGNSPGGGGAAGGGEAAAPPASRPVDPGGPGAAASGPQAPAAAGPPNLMTLQMMAAQAGQQAAAAAVAPAPAALNAAASAAAANPGADTPGSPAADPLWVLDASNGTVFTSAAAHTFSTWSEDLRAQSANVSTPLSYSWDLSQAPDATNVSGLGTYRLQLTWASFTGAARSDTITPPTTDANNGQQTQALHFTVEGTDSPAFASSRPTTAATWPTVLTPDQLQGEATVAAGPFAAIGLQAGDVQASHDLPGYDPNVAPLALVYGSLGADPQPVFIAHYELPGVQGRPPSQVSAQLTLNGVAGPTVYWYTSSLTPGDILELPLQSVDAGLAT